jgi:hypothetical protein
VGPTCTQARHMARACRLRPCPLRPSQLWPSTRQGPCRPPGCPSPLALQRRRRSLAPAPTVACPSNVVLLGASRGALMATLPQQQQQQQLAVTGRSHPLAAVDLGSSGRARPCSLGVRRGPRDLPATCSRAASSGHHLVPQALTPTSSSSSKVGVAGCSRSLVPPAPAGRLPWAAPVAATAGAGSAAVQQQQQQQQVCHPWRQKGGPHPGVLHRAPQHHLAKAPQGQAWGSQPPGAVAQPATAAAAATAACHLREVVVAAALVA